MKKRVVPKPSPLTLRPEDEVLLGRIPDSDIAKLTKIPRGVITVQRRQKNIAPYVSPDREQITSDPTVRDEEAQSAPHAESAVLEVPTPQTGEQILAAAKALVYGSRFDFGYDLTQDLVSEVSLAYIEGRCPLSAMSEFLALEERAMALRISF